MRRPSFARETVTVLRAGPANRHGERELIASFEVGHCSVTPGGSSEINDGAERVISTMNLIGPPILEAVRAYDRIEHRGVRYQVDGDPAVWPHHCELRIRRVEG